MIDWNILSPTYLAAMAEWAGAAVTVLAMGPAPAKQSRGRVGS
jgi:hypothetical protein